MRSREEVKERLEDLTHMMFSLTRIERSHYYTDNVLLALIAELSWVLLEGEESSVLQNE